ncbi:MAG: alpha/beta hydrolase-fold protein [Planctomycetota bacterium]
MAEAAPEGEAPPKGKALKELVSAYLDADAARRRTLRRELDARLAPLEPKEAQALRKSLLDLARKRGPKLEKGGSSWFYEEGRGRYISAGKPGPVLFIGLHGGGAGSGDASSSASAMGGGGWWWIHPEVLEKTEHGWTDAGTDRFVLDLVQAAKRTAKVDPDRIYITGHSMGGYGSWTLGAQHADVWAGAAPFAGAPTAYYRSPTDKTVVGIQDGILPSFYNLPLHVYQSLDDVQVTPESNIFANQALTELKARFPKGFDWKYVEVDGRGHAAPAEGYLPALEWLASHKRNARPQVVHWQPSLPWKQHFYWLWWEQPELGAWLEVSAGEDNSIDVKTIQGSGDVTGLSLLVGAPLVDLERPITVRVDGEQRFHGVVPRTLSTMLMTLPREDDALLFDARIDLDPR